MIRFNLLVLATFLLAGCGGDFSSSWSRAGVDADTDAMAPSTGGAPGTGGASQETGGAPTTGGSPATGGASTGGALVTGGAPATTGGTPGTGAAPATGGALVEPDAGCPLVTHDNGLGQTWQDCVPLGTYDLEQAMKACKASGATACDLASGCPDYAVHGAFVGNWGYSGPVAGYASSGGLCGGPAGTRWR